MNYTQKSMIVKFAVVIVVVLSSLLNGHLQMNRKAEKVENIFMNGENQDGLSIHYDLEKIDDSMSYCISLAKANQKQNQEYIKKLETLHQQFSSIETIADYSEWYQDVKDVYPLAISYLESVELSNEHQKMLSKYQATYNSAIHTIAYSSYNEYVREYEKETSGLIAGVIKTITGVKKVTSFD